MDASWLSQIHTNIRSLTLYKLTALVTAQLFSGPTEGHHLRKVRLQIDQVKSTFLAESRLDFAQKAFNKHKIQTASGEGNGNFRPRAD